jgi:hypothetical protein
MAARQNKSPDGIPLCSSSPRIESLETCWEMERTFAIIKPDAMRNGKAEAIMSDIQNAGADYFSNFTYTRT